MLMHRTWRAVVYAAILATPVAVTVAMATAAAAGAPSVRPLEPAAVHAAAEQGIALVDVRRPDEWRATGVAPGSLLITAFDADGRPLPGFLDAVRANVSPDQPVMLICRTGNRSAAAARLLTEQGGYRQVSNATGGITAWIDTGQPVVPCPTC